MVIMPHKLSPAKSTGCLLSMENHHHPNDYMLGNGNGNGISSIDCSLCWSSSDVCCSSADSVICVNGPDPGPLNGMGTTGRTTIVTTAHSGPVGSTIFGKCRNVRLRRTDPNQSLGFSIRGGK